MFTVAFGWYGFSLHYLCVFLLLGFRVTLLDLHGFVCNFKGLPSRFCVDNFPEETMEIVLEDEEGEEYEAVYIGRRSGLSGGWKRFALDHKLDDGDALLFQLVEPKRFKVCMCLEQESCGWS